MSVILNRRNCVTKIRLVEELLRFGFLCFGTGSGALFEDELEYFQIKVGNPFATLDLPPQRQIDARAHGIEDEGFGEAAVSWQFRGSTGGAGGFGGFRGGFDILDFHAEVIDPFAPVARRQDRQVDVTIGKIDRAAILGRLAAAGDLVKTERCSVELREFFGVLGE